MNLQPKNFPYHHSTVDRFTNLAKLLKFRSLIESREWVSHTAELYRFSSLQESRFIHTEFFHSEQEEILKYLNEMGAHICDRTADVFRLNEGDGIGIHDDHSVNAYRLAISLSETRPIEAGGGFMLFGRKLNDMLIYPATLNSGVLFRTDQQHRHAISVACGSPLYFLVFQFLISPATITVEDV